MKRPLLGYTATVRAAIFPRKQFVTGLRERRQVGTVRPFRPRNDAGGLGRGDGKLVGGE